MCMFAFFATILNSLAFLTSFRTLYSYPYALFILLSVTLTLFVTSQPFSQPFLHLEEFITVRGLRLPRATEKFVFSATLHNSSEPLPLNIFLSPLSSLSGVTVEFDSLHPINDDGIPSSFRVQLKKNSDFISEHFKYNSTASDTISDDAFDYLSCFFSGQVENFSGSSVSLNLCDGFHGLLSFSSKTHFSVHSVRAAGSLNKILYVLIRHEIPIYLLPNGLRKRQVPSISASSTSPIIQATDTFINNPLVPQTLSGEGAMPIATSLPPYAITNPSVSLLSTMSPMNPMASATIPPPVSNTLPASPTPPPITGTTPLTLLVTIANDPVRVQMFPGTTFKQIVDMFYTVHQLFKLLTPSQPIYLVLKNVIDLHPSVQVPNESLQSSVTLTKWWTTIWERHRDGSDAGYLITMNNTHVAGGQAPSACSLPNTGIPVGVIPGYMDATMTTMQLAHAIGHTLGMTHDTPPTCQGIMQFPVPTTFARFSSCSINNLVSHLATKDVSKLKKTGVSTSVQYFAITAQNGAAPPAPGAPGMPASPLAPAVPGIPGVPSVPSTSTPPIAPGVPGVPASSAYPIAPIAPAVPRAVYV